MEITIWSRGLETQQYKKLEKTFEDWMAMNDDEREAHWKKFLNYCFDDDKKTVTATNKKLTVFQTGLENSKKNLEKKSF